VIKFLHQDDPRLEFSRATPPAWFGWLSRGAPYLAWAGVIALGWLAIGVFGPIGGIVSLAILIIAAYVVLKVL
jgi:hypothetical protein